MRPRWWEFDLDRYSASLSAAMEITPDEKNPTASDSTMKSGYGVNQVVTARVNSSQRSATTALQNAVSYFPEFNYESFWRLLDRISISSSSSRLEFQKNEYSTYNRRTHFTPIWYRMAPIQSTPGSLTAGPGRDALGQPHRFTEYPGQSMGRLAYRSA